MEMAGSKVDNKQSSANSGFENVIKENVLRSIFFIHLFDVRIHNLRTLLTFSEY